MIRFKIVSPRFIAPATSAFLVAVLLVLLLSSCSKAQLPMSKDSKKKKSGHNSPTHTIGKKEAKKGGTTTNKKRKKSDLIAFWYKPHYQCNGSGGSTQERAARFINQQLDDDYPAAPAADFVGISQWVGSQNGTIIGHPDKYGVIGSVCGYAQTEYTTPVALFYRFDHWKLQASYPSLANQCNFVPTLPWEGPKIGTTCVNKVQPTTSSSSSDDDGNNCCSCTYSEQEYELGVELNLNLGQRPWVAGRFLSKNKNTKQPRQQEICVVAGEVPHPMHNTTLTNLNGNMIQWNEPNPKPYRTERNQCTSTLPLNKCVPNLSNSSILFGTDTLMAGVTEFCGTDIPILFMADTNVMMGYVSTGSLFLKEPLRSLVSYADDTLNSYTCCNGTSYGGGLNAFASDRIAVTSNDLIIDHFEGGSVAPTGPVPHGMQYQCSAASEHLPLRAFISFHK